jgi:hypothetical protein
MPAHELAGNLETLLLAIQEGDAGGVLVGLKDLVPGYNPSSFVLRRALEGRAHGAFAGAT